MDDLAAARTDGANRQAILPFPEWRKCLNDDDLKALKAAGFDFLRMPVDPSPFLSDQHCWRCATDLYASRCVDSARLINRAGLKVVVDMHLIPAGGSRSIGMGEVMDDPTTFDRYVELVRTMAHTLAAEDPSTGRLRADERADRRLRRRPHQSWPDRLQQLLRRGARFGHAANPRC